MSPLYHSSHKRLLQVVNLCNKELKICERERRRVFVCETGCFQSKVTNYVSTKTRTNTKCQTSRGQKSYSASFHFSDLRFSICYFYRFRTISFAFFTRVFLRVFKGKIHYDRNNAAYGWHTWRRRRLYDLLWAEEQNSPLLLSFSWRRLFPQNFVVDEQPTNFPPTWLVMWTGNSHSCSFSLSYLEPSNRKFK